jgi:hypothetical protein
VVFNWRSYSRLLCLEGWVYGSYFFLHDTFTLLYQPQQTALRGAGRWLKDSPPSSAAVFCWLPGWLTFHNYFTNCAPIRGVGVESIEAAETWEDHHFMCLLAMTGTYLVLCPLLVSYLHIIFPSQHFKNHKPLHVARDKLRPLKLLQVVPFNKQRKNNHVLRYKSEVGSRFTVS